MGKLLSEAGRSFLRAFAGSLIVFAPGILSAPTLEGAKLLAFSALIASVVAGLKAIQVFVPRLSFKSWLASTRFAAYYVYADSFVRAFVGTLLVGLIGWFSLPSFTFDKSLIVGIIVAAVVAAIRAVQGFLSKGEHPAPSKGF